MQISAGILIIFENKCLLVHPTKAKDDKWGIPKGRMENCETYQQTASRECNEEIGVYINPQLLINPKEIIYRSGKSRKIYKRIYYFIHKINSLSEIGLSSETVPIKQLQLIEVDKAKFINREGMEKCLFWRMKELLNEKF